MTIRMHEECHGCEKTLDPNERNREEQILDGLMYFCPACWENHLLRGGRYSEMESPQLMKLDPGHLREAMNNIGKKIGQLNCELANVQSRFSFLEFRYCELQDGKGN